MIGNDSYLGNALQNARNDAQAVSGALSKVGYVSTLVLDADRATLVGKVDQFVETLHAGDTALLYYAGHGMQVDGENYLVPWTSISCLPIRQRSKVIHSPRFLSISQVTALPLKSLFSTHAETTPFLGTRSTRGSWAGLGTSAGAFLAFGTSPGSTASDAPGQGHGLFTKDLLRYLTSSNLDIEEMFRQVREDVIRDSDGKQVPWIASSLIGSYHILPQFDGQQRLLPTIAESKSGPQALDSRAFKRTLAESLPQPSESATASLAEASTLVRGAKFDMAIKILHDILEVNPACAAALRLLGLVYYLAGRDADAISTMDRALKLDGHDVRAAEYKCALEGISDSASAVPDCEATVRQNPSAESYLALAGTEQAQGDDTRAYANVSRSIDMSGSDLAYALPGSMAQRQGNTSQAQRDFTQAVQTALATR